MPTDYIQQSQLRRIIISIGKHSDAQSDRARKRNGIAMTQGKHFAAGGDHFAALPNKKIHTPKGIARLTVTAATMAAMTGSSLISPFAAFC